MPEIRCSACRNPFPVNGVPYICPNCGGTWDFDGPPNFDPDSIEPDLPGLWRYRHSFSLADQSPVISIGEGRTPLVWDSIDGRSVYFKMEHLNPTWSYKDRGSSVLLSQLVARNCKSAVEDSSGNAGASFAAYAARAGIKGRVFVPESASGPKRSQIELYGAELIRIPGPRSAAADAVLTEVKAGAVYASHAYLPFGLPGIASIAYEIWEELDEVPGSVIMPVGHGGLMLGVLRGFQALKKRALVPRLPFMVGVQAANCSPIVSAYNEGESELVKAGESPTIAEGVRVRNPVRAKTLLQEIPQGTGSFLAIQEEAILPAYRFLAGRGILVEPTSALVWAGYQTLIKELPQPVVLILSGSGLKYQPTS